MPTDEEQRVLEAQRRMENAHAKAGREINLDQDFWDVYKGRKTITLERGEKGFRRKSEDEWEEISDFLEPEFKAAGIGEKGKKFEVEIGGIEKEFIFEGYRVHAYSSKGVAGVAMLRGEKIVGTIVLHTALNFAKARVKKRVLADAAGNALFTRLLVLFSQNLGGIKEEGEGKGMYAFVRPLKTTRAYAAFTYLLLNKKVETFEDLKKEVERLATALDLDPITTTSYLRDVLSKEEAPNLAKLASIFIAETKKILKLWEQTKDIEDLRKRVEKTAELAYIDPLTCTTYLVAVLPKGEKQGVQTLRGILTAEAKDIENLWKATEHIKDLEERVRETARLAKISPVTCCSYVAAIIPRGERMGIQKLKQKLQAESKGILKFWAQTSHISDKKARVVETARLANIEPVTCCGYLGAALPEDEKSEIYKLLSLFAAEATEVLKFWEQNKHIQDPRERVIETAKSMEISPVTCAGYLCVVLKGEEKKALYAIWQKLKAEAKDIEKLWKQTSNIPDLEEKIFKICGLADIGAVTAAGYVSEIVPHELKGAVNAIWQRLKAEAKKVEVHWKTTAHITDLRARIIETARLAGIDPVTCASYLSDILPEKERAGIAGIRKNMQIAKRGAQES